jgi:hypothetical protein
MNLKIIINSIIIIFILHLLIQNINSKYEFNIGNKSANKTLDFLFNNSIEPFNNMPSFNNNVPTLNNMNNNINSRDNLLNYVKESSKIDNPFPSNSNLESNSTPNFNSDDKDLSKFFTYYDNLDESQLSKTLQPITQNDKNNQFLNTQYEEQQQVWKYKNELPMNGGSINNIIGYDSSDSIYASINFNDSIKNKNNINDLRNGMEQKNI